MRTVCSLVAAALVGLSSPALAQQSPAAPDGQPAAQPAPAPQERVAAVKKSFTESQAKLRTFEWIETTVITLKGEEKSRKQSRCYYGAEGKIEKVPLAPAPEEKPARGIRGRIKENKKEELADYMQEAAALVHKYLPPLHEKIQKSVDAGKSSIHIIEAGKRARLEFKDYLQPGDALSVEIDLADNRILGLGVASTLAKEKDPVTLDVRFDKFPDGTIYTAETKLEAKAKHVKVTVTNSGYRNVAP